jgi:hypothetical protein
MKATPRTTQKMAREAFGLLLDLRERDNAHQLLSQAIAFLEMLGREKDVDSTPVILSVRLRQMRRS